MPPGGRRRRGWPRGRSRRGCEGVLLRQSYEGGSTAAVRGGGFCGCLWLLLLVNGRGFVVVGDTVPVVCCAAVLCRWRSVAAPNHDASSCGVVLVVVVVVLVLAVHLDKRDTSSPYSLTARCLLLLFSVSADFPTIPLPPHAAGGGWCWGFQVLPGAGE